MEGWKIRSNSQKTEWLINHILGIWRKYNKIEGRSINGYYLAKCGKVGWNKVIPKCITSRTWAWDIPGCFSALSKEWRCCWWNSDFLGSCPLKGKNSDEWHNYCLKTGEGTVGKDPEHAGWFTGDAASFRQTLSRGSVGHCSQIFQLFKRCLTKALFYFALTWYYWETNWKVLKYSEKLCYMN